MNRSDLINTLKDKTQLSRKDAEKAVNIFFNSITDSLATGERVEIRGFGSMAAKEYMEYTGRNPKTGEQIVVPPKRLPFFKPGKELREKVDN